MDDMKNLFQSIQRDLTYLREHTVSKQMLLQSEQRTKEAIHSVYEVAVTVEDRAEVGDVLVKSFVDALGEKTSKELQEIKLKLTSLEQTQHEGIREIVTSLDEIRKILELSLQQDAVFAQKLQKHEAAIEQLKRKLG